MGQQTYVCAFRSFNSSRVPQHTWHRRRPPVAQTPRGHLSVRAVSATANGKKNAVFSRVLFDSTKWFLTVPLASSNVELLKSIEEVQQSCCSTFHLTQIFFRLKTD